MKRWFVTCALVALAACSRKSEPSQPPPVAPEVVAAPKPDAQEPPKQAAADDAPSLEDGVKALAAGDGKLHVYFLDVGQGDATFIVSPTGKTVLIDAGCGEEQGHVSHRLPELLNEPVDLLVLSHPHPDCLAPMVGVVKSIGAKRFLDPRLPSDDAEYAALLAELKTRNIPVFAPTPDPKAPFQPVRIKLGGGASLSIYWPRVPAEALIDAGPRSADANGIVARVELGETSLMLEADAQPETEAQLLSRRLPFESSILHVAAHGAEGPSSMRWLSAVKPLAAIISVGAGNSQGVPTRSVMDRLQRAGAKVFRTDLDGEIQAVSDGKAFALSVERPAAGEEAGTEHVLERNASPQSRVNPALAKAAAARKAKLAAEKTSKGKAAAKEKESAKTNAKQASAKAPSGKVVYVASKQSKVFHVENCGAAKRIKKENLVVFSSRDEAAKDRRPAGDCNP